MRVEQIHSDKLTPGSRQTHNPHIQCAQGVKSISSSFMLVLHSSLRVLHLWIPTSLIKENQAMLERMVFAPNQSPNGIN